MGLPQHTAERVHRSNIPAGAVVFGQNRRTLLAALDIRLIHDEEGLEDIYQWQLLLMQRVSIHVCCNPPCSFQRLGWFSIQALFAPCRCHSLCTEAATSYNVDIVVCVRHTGYVNQNVRKHSTRTLYLQLPSSTFSTTSTGPSVHHCVHQDRLLRKA